MRPPLSIRRATEDDATALLALRTLIFAETAFMLWEAGEFHDTAADEAGRIRRLNDSRNGLMLVAEGESGLVGFLGAFGGIANRQRHATSLALGVRRSAWGRGAATALIEHTIAWAAAAGIVRIDLTVHCANQRAVALYERLGFQKEGVRSKSLLVDGQYVDEYLMARVQPA